MRSWMRSLWAELGFDAVEPARPRTRRLEREAGRNVEVMWPLARLVPDHKSIADFRKDNGPALRKVRALGRTAGRWGFSRRRPSTKLQSRALPRAGGPCR